MSLSYVDPPVEAGLGNSRAATHPDPIVTIVTIRVPAGGPVHLFYQMTAALDGRDFRAATSARRDLLRRFGWRILPPACPPWGGGRRP